MDLVIVEGENVVEVGQADPYQMDKAMELIAKGLPGNLETEI